MRPYLGKRRRNAVRYPLAAFTAVCLCASIPAARAASGGQSDIDSLREQQAYLRNLPLGELINLDVTSVSRRPQHLSDAAAAVFVVTREDIRRSGATSIPEVLRMVPGLHVARLDSNIWAVTSRGFNNRFANKLLVLIDGRSVYTSLFSGVYWDEQDLMLEDVDRVEVIRGPGATLWGANAVNGVINIVSRSASETQGTRAIASLGNEEKGSVALRHGGRIGDLGHYRVYGKFFARDGGVDLDGRAVDDDWDKASAGLRLDLDGAGGSWLLDARLYDGENGQLLAMPDPVPPYVRVLDDPVESSGGHLLGRWEAHPSAVSDFRLQGYFDHVDRRDPAAYQRVNTFDLDFQHRYRGIAGHEVVWGAGLRYIDHTVSEAQAEIPIYPGHHDLRLFSAFLQDEIALFDDRLKVTLGSKIEHNSFTGVEIQPNLRAAWKAGPHSTLWGSVARAVRTPSIFERDGFIPLELIPGGVPTEPAFVGSADYDSESVIAYELGYRVSPSPTLNLDLAVYYNRYDELRSAEIGMPYLDLTTFPRFVVPIRADNLMYGHGYGAEAALKWHPRPDLRFDLAYTWYELHLELESGSTDQLSTPGADADPCHQLSLRGAWDPAPDWELDAWVRYVDDLPALQLDGYLTLDLRAAWRIRRGLELSLVGQNLLDVPREEFRSEFTQNPSTLVERGVYLKLDWSL